MNVPAIIIIIIITTTFMTTHLQVIILTAIFMFIWLLAGCIEAPSKSAMTVGDKAAMYKLDAKPISQHPRQLNKELCSLMYRVVNGSAPTYLTELCQPCSDT